MGLVLLVGPSLGRAGDSVVILIIANKAVTERVLSEDNARLIFQRKREDWPDGSHVRAVNLPPENPARKAFDLAVLRLDPERMMRYWIDCRVRGANPPPSTVPTSAMVVKVVSKMVGGVGYIEAAALDSSVKVVAKVINGKVVAP